MDQMATAYAPSVVCSLLFLLFFSPFPLPIASLAYSPTHFIAELASHPYCFDFQRQKLLQVSRSAACTLPAPRWYRTHNTMCMFPFWREFDYVSSFCFPSYMLWLTLWELYMLNHLP
jgi:hypothetical protein